MKPSRREPSVSSCTRSDCAHWDGGLCGDGRIATACRRRRDGRWVESVEAPASKLVWVVPPDAIAATDLAAELGVRVNALYPLVLKYEVAESLLTLAHGKRYYRPLDPVRFSALIGLWKLEGRIDPAFAQVSREGMKIETEAVGFDGSTYSPEYDRRRLAVQFARVRDLMLAGHWWTLSEIAEALGYPEASVSARLRDLRKPRFGAYVVERRSRGSREDGLFEYHVRVAQGGSGGSEARGGRGDGVLRGCGLQEGDGQGDPLHHRRRGSLVPEESGGLFVGGEGRGRRGPVGSDALDCRAERLGVMEDRTMTMDQIKITDFGGTAQVIGVEREFYYRARKGRLCIEGLKEEEAKLVLATLVLGGVKGLTETTAKLGESMAQAATAAAPSAPPPAPAPEKEKPSRAAKPAPKKEEPASPDPAGLTPPGKNPDVLPTAGLPPASPVVAPQAVEPAPEPPKPAAPAPKAAAPVAVEGVDVGALAGKSKLRDILSSLLRAGYDKPEKLIAVCEQIKDQVPVLARIADLSERIPRTLDVMGYPDNLE